MNRPGAQRHDRRARDGRGGADGHTLFLALINQRDRRCAQSRSLLPPETGIDARYRVSHDAVVLVVNASLAFNR